MKLTNLEIWTANIPLQQLNQQKFPVRVSYALAKLAQKLNEQVKIIDEVRQGLVKKHGEKDEKTGQPTIQPNTPAMEAFSAEWVDLLKQEVEVDIKETIKLPDKVAATCDKCHHNMDKALEVEPVILLALDKFIEVG
jgi:hypothetical protein